MSARVFTEPEVQAANDSGCIFYDDPATLTDEQIDPLLRNAVRRINRSGWVWTAESCQGHPDSTDPAGPWAGNTRPMLRLVCRVENRPRMFDALTQAFAESNNWDDRPTVRSIAVWPYERRNGWFEALVYVPAATAGERGAGCRAYDRFAEIVMSASGPSGGNGEDAMSESYPDGWVHATIHLNPKTGEYHLDGENSNRGRVEGWLQDLRFESDSAEPEREETVWIPSVPLPFLGLRTDRCSCGAKFRGRDRKEAYELHWRRVHEPEIRANKISPSVSMEVTRAEAAAIYAKVRAAGPSGGDR